MPRQWLDKKFSEWLEGKDIEYDYSYADKRIAQSLRGIGVTKSKLLSEKDPFRIRVYTSELVTRRDRVNLPDFDDYLLVIQLLIAYAEFLENRAQLIEAKKKGEPPKKDKDKVVWKCSSDEALIVSYYLSRANFDAVHKLGYKSFNEAFRDLGEKLGQKPNTIKNMRDEFDPYFDNGRAGWFQREMKGNRKQIFDQYADVSDAELVRKVRAIIRKGSKKNGLLKEPEKGSKKGSKKSPEKAHAKLKIHGNSGMKEIKKKK